MKTLTEYINEAMNKEAMFMGKESRRTADDFKFVPGEKAILIKYSTDGYNTQVRGVYEIGKVGKNSVKLNDSDEFYASMKFDKYGIYVVKNKNKYRGNSTDYWVLYNKELIDDTDLKELSNDGNCMWGFRFKYNADESRKNLKELIEEIS